MSRLQLNNSSSHHSIYSNFQKRHLPFLLPPKSTITPKVLGLRQRHGAKETQAVCPNENPRKCWNPNWQTSTAVRRRSEYFRPRSFDISDNGFWFGVKIPNKLVPVKTNTFPENWWLEDEISFFWVDILVFKKYGFAGHFSHQPCPFFASFVSQKTALVFFGTPTPGSQKMQKGWNWWKDRSLFFCQTSCDECCFDISSYDGVLFTVCCQFHLKLIKKVHGTSMAQDFSKKTRHLQLPRNPTIGIRGGGHALAEDPRKPLKFLTFLWLKTWHWLTQISIYHTAWNRTTKLITFFLCFLGFEVRNLFWELPSI